MLLLGPVDGRQVPIRLRDRLNVVDFEGSMSHFAVDNQIDLVNGGEQPRR